VILYKNYNLELIDNGNFWIIKNVNEEALLEFIGIARLKLDVIANNIANINTENYLRKYVKITVENGIEIVDDTENVDLTRETVDMIEIQRLFEASIEYLMKINKNIVIM
jgi:flagellar basal body rod protein FlgB